ncbi:MAG: proteasome activator [Actinomycetota bacterium]
MTDQQDGTTPQPGAPTPRPSAPDESQFLDPQRLLRVAGVAREVLEEARRIRPEPAAVQHLRDVHNQITAELRAALPGKLFHELDELTPEVRDGTLEELALAHAEILGWLEGLFQGTQLAIQLHAARALQPRSASAGPGAAPGPTQPDTDRTDGRYL